MIRVDLFENEIESACIQLIALHQPVASELRFLTMVMKISHDIERLADKSVAIAKRSIELLEYPPVKPFVDLPYVAQSHSDNGKGCTGRLCQSQRRTRFRNSRTGR